jgi:hypothetical protein
MEPARARAESFLTEQLSGGPQPSSDVMSAAVREGFSERTVRRAFKEIGAVAKPTGFQEPWQWSLPDPSELASADDEMLANSECSSPELEDEEVA